MISSKTALEILKKLFPDREITAFLDYDKDWYIFDCHTPNTDGYENLISVDKHTGAVRAFYPAADIEKYVNAIEKRGFVKINTK